MFQRTARIVPPWAAVFLIIMAVLINSPALFYMASAMVATILACRFQAWLSVRGLRIERLAPPAVHTGELVTVSMTIWSDHRTKRPLITVEDALPLNLRLVDRTPSLPVAPSFDQPIQSRYSFRPLRRGKYRWSVVNVIGTDALGLVPMTRRIRTETNELTVYPARIPLHMALRPTGGSAGVTEAESGKYRGSGLEPRGVREYVPGDPVRYIHWPSSARSGRVMVKEFEAGSNLAATMLLQRTKGTELGDGITTLEAMCGHAVYLCEEFLKMGATVRFPAFGLDHPSGANYDEQMQRINEMLAGVQADSAMTITEDLKQVLSGGEGGSVYVMIAVADDELPTTIARAGEFKVTCLIYDPADYPQKAALPGTSAANADYLHRLREAGAEVILLPQVREVR